MPAPHDETSDNDLTPMSPDPLDDLLALTEDYFPPLPPRPPVNLRPTIIHTAPGHRPTLSQAASVASLSAQPTTAISLPEGVYAQQQDGVSSGNGGSVTTAPSFSDAASGNSRKSVEPTMKVADDADVESMIGEILGEDERWLVLPEAGLPNPEAESDSDDDADSEASDVSDREDIDDETIPEGMISWPFLCSTPNTPQKPASKTSAPTANTSSSSPTPASPSTPATAPPP